MKDSDRSFLFTLLCLILSHVIIGWLSVLFAILSMLWAGLMGLSMFIEYQERRIEEHISKI